MPIDFTRVAGTIDPDIMRRATVALVGCGGGRRKAELLAHTAVGRIILIDPDIVEGRNPATQGHRYADLGKLKVEATAEAIRAINPETEIVTLAMTWDEATAAHGEGIAKADCLIIATDSYHANRAARRWAIQHGIPAIDAQHYPGAACVEHVLTTPDIIARNGGCGTCHCKLRFDAFETGYITPKDIATNVFAAELSCVQTALIVTALLHHRAGSLLPIVGIAEAFNVHPFHLTRILPGFWAAPGEPFADAPADGQAFFSRGYALDTPIGWRCPDCGCSRSAAP